MLSGWSIVPDVRHDGATGELEVGYVRVSFEAERDYSPFQLAAMRRARAVFDRHGQPDPQVELFEHPNSQVEVHLSGDSITVQLNYDDAEIYGVTSTGLEFSIWFEQFFFDSPRELEDCVVECLDLFLQGKSCDEATRPLKAIQEAYWARRPSFLGFLTGAWRDAVQTFRAAWKEDDERK